MENKRSTDHAISKAVNQLKQEHIRLCKELARVDEALSVLGGLGAKQGLAVKSGRLAMKSKRKVSAAARKKMSEAARARWAAHRKAQTKTQA